MKTHPGRKAGRLGRKHKKPKIVSAKLGSTGILHFITSMEIAAYQVLVSNSKLFLPFQKIVLEAGVVDHFVGIIGTGVTLEDLTNSPDLVVRIRIKSVSRGTWSRWYEKADISEFLSAHRPTLPPPSTLEIKNQLAPLPAVSPPMNGDHGVNGHGKQLSRRQFVWQSLDALLEPLARLTLWSRNGHSKKTTAKPKQRKQNNMKKKSSAGRKAAARAAANTKPAATSAALETLPTFTDDAWAWMTDKKSIPGACGAPITFLGMATAEAFFDILGHSITLEEAKRLVQPDGDKCECSVRKGFKFQPVAYAPYAPGGLKKQLEEGKTLLDAELRFGGQFYLRGTSEVLPISGTVFTYIEAQQSYEYSWASPLVIAAREFRKKEGHFNWGVTRDSIDRVFEKKRERNKMADDVRTLVTSIIKARPRPGQRLNPVADALPQRKRKK